MNSKFFSVKSAEFTNFGGWFWKFGIEGIALLVIFSLAVYTEKPSDIPVVGRYFFCPFKEITGFSCPGCGMTRAFIAFFHAEFADALRLNFLVYFIAPFLIFRFSRCVSGTLAGKYPEINVFSPVPLFVFFSVAIVFSVARLLCEIFGSP